MRHSANSTFVPEIIRYFRHKNYLMAEVREQEEAVVLARLISPRFQSIKKNRPEKIVNLIDRRKRENMKKLSVGLLFLIFFIGCAPVQQRSPLIYTMPPNANYQQDRADCERFAERAVSEDPTITQGAVAGGVGGALIGAALGAIIGGAFGMPGAGAGWGAGYGGVSGAASGAGVNAVELTRRTQEAVIKCLKAKGYEDASY